MKTYHRVFAEIDIDDIEENLKEIKAYIGNDKEIMVIIKADAYGHGAIPIARHLYEAGINSIGVATLNEAIALRKYNIDIPIVILGYSPEEEYDRLVKYDIIQTVYKTSIARGISQAAKTMDKKVKIHIKIDTGMTRLGFYPDTESVKSIIEISKLPNIEIDGIFTHFARADEESREFTLQQIEKFNNFIEMLKEEGLKIPKLHTANSAGMLGYKEAHYDIVRVGIALYGLYPSKEMEKSNVKLKPSLSLKSNIIFLKQVKAGTAVSYGGSFVTQNDCKIATIPVGYGDGYPRSLSSKGRVLIRGEYAPIVGRICMDQFMVDVTHIENVSEGDEAVLIGKQGDNSITVEEVAELDGTINYEIVCQLGKRIPRVYYKKGIVVSTVDYF